MIYLLITKFNLDEQPFIETISTEETNIRIIEDIISKNVQKMVNDRLFREMPTIGSHSFPTFTNELLLLTSLNFELETTEYYYELWIPFESSNNYSLVPRTADHTAIMVGKALSILQQKEQMVISFDRENEGITYVFIPRTKVPIELILQMYTRCGYCPFKYTMYRPDPPDSKILPDISEEQLAQIPIMEYS